MMWKRVALLALAAMMTGCAKSQTFQVAIKNQTTQPITVGFAKEEGGPFEPAWATPEQVAMESPADSGRTWDSVVVPPGHAGVAGPISGKFDGSARAYLRVYATEGKLDELMAISRGSPRRADVPLAPGRNALVVREEAGRLAVERVNVPPPK